MTFWQSLKHGCRLRQKTQLGGFIFLILMRMWGDDPIWRWHVSDGLNRRCRGLDAQLEVVGLLDQGYSRGITVRSIDLHLICLLLALQVRKTNHLRCQVYGLDVNTGGLPIHPGKDTWLTYPRLPCATKFRWYWGWIQTMMESECLVLRAPVKMMKLPFSWKDSFSCTFQWLGPTGIFSCFGISALSSINSSFKHFCQRPFTFHPFPGPPVKAACVYSDLAGQKIHRLRGARTFFRWEHVNRLDPASEVLCTWNWFPAWKNQWHP